MDNVNFDVNFDKLIIDTIDTVTFFDKTDGSILFMADQVTDGTMENGAETVYGTGKAGVRLSALDRNKTSKFSFNNGYVLANALAAQVGSEVEEASASNKFAVPHMQMIEVTDPTKVTLEFTPLGATGNEIPFIYMANADKTQGKKYPIAAAASAEAFSLDPKTKVVTLPTDAFKAGDVVIIPYNREATVGKKISNVGDAGSKTGRTVIDVTCRDICDQSTVYHAIIEYKNSKIDGNFSLAFGNEPVKHPIAIEALLDVCSTDKSLWTYYIAG